MVKKHIFRDDNTKKWLINKKLKKYESKNTPMKKWRQNENLALLDIVASNLNMSGHNPTVFKNYNNFSGDDYNLIPIKSGHKDKVREIISKTDLRQLYRDGPGRKVEKIIIITTIAIGNIPLFLKMIDYDIEWDRLYDLFTEFLQQSSIGLRYFNLYPLDFNEINKLFIKVISNTRYNLTFIL